VTLSALEDGSLALLDRHASRMAFETDVARRRRSSHLAYTYGDVFERGAQTAAELAPLLS
jgi:hypothetical protein